MSKILIYPEREGMISKIRVSVNASRCNNVLINCQLKYEGYNKTILLLNNLFADCQNQEDLTHNEM